MVNRDDLVTFLDELLKINDIPGDKSANGLQVEGSVTVGKVVGAVDACQETYRAAVAAGGEFIFVHHGEFWSSLSGIRGRIAERFRLLFQSDLSLYAAHLPLDAHPELGHNAEIARLLGLQNRTAFAEYCGACIGFHGELPEAMSCDDLAALINAKLDTTCQVYNPGLDKFRRIGIISGGGASSIEECAELELDCLVTGEVNHTWYHPIQELGVALITAGHYKTEVPGILTVLDAITKKFGIETEFIDIPTGL